MECTTETYAQMFSKLVKENLYAEAARLAGRYGDHGLKMRTCMDGIRHYEEELMYANRDAASRPDKRQLLTERADIHEKISELYLIFGNRRMADAHMNLSLQSANGIVPERD